MYRILFLAAALPAVFLIWKIYKMDRVEKEPTGLLVSLVFLAIGSILIAMVCESLGGSILASFLMPDTVLYNLVFYFFVVGLSEELAKYLMLRLRTWRSPAFNCRFDGVVYAVTVSLGFALWENVAYVMQYGFTTAVLRAVTAIPGHACFGVFMGVWYGAAKHCELAGGSKTKALRRRAIWIPVVLHGLYDFIASLGGSLFTFAFIAYIAVLFLISWGTAKRAAQEDLYFGQSETQM